MEELISILSIKHSRQTCLGRDSNLRRGRAHLTKSYLRAQLINLSILSREAKKHTDPDGYSEHW
jgi:hypothetical protein